MPDYDILIRNGTLCDGSGSPSVQGDVAIAGDKIAAVGTLAGAHGRTEIDADGLIVAPGFINMLSWSVESLIEDGRSQSEIRQGVTLEVMGEGTSMGPLSDKMKAEWRGGILGNSDIRYTIEWTTLNEYLETIERQGVSPNVTSFVGSSTLRAHVVGYDNRPATPEEVRQMQALLRQALEDGAVGLSTALIYPPASYASTEEILALAEVVAAYDGLYISHIRGEGGTLLDALDELFTIARQAKVRAEIYHLKAAGRSHWDKMDEAIRRIEAARAEGLAVTADMYTYPYSGTGLDSCIPEWAHDGGFDALIARLKAPAERERIKAEMRAPSSRWENMYYENGPDGIILGGFSTEALKPYTGQSLRQIAEARGTAPEDTVMDLLVEDDSSLFALYFSMTEDNLRKQIGLPWVSFCSDAESQAPEGPFLKANPHPRAYGSFARVLGKYVRDEGLLTLEDAIRRLTSFPAANLKLQGRGTLQPGYCADVVVFDLARVQDYATPAQPHQYSTGMLHVLVNGVPVLTDGEHTGAKPGRVVRGPGWRPA